LYYLYVEDSFVMAIFSFFFCFVFCVFFLFSSIVYNTAALAVAYNKGTGKQQFLKGAHIDEVLGICRHPAGQIFATGEAGRCPSIIIW
jgi:hypothetical protein